MISFAEGDRNRPHTCKIVLAGEAGVGKTSIFKRIRDGTFHEGTQSTIGQDYCDVHRQLRNGDTIHVALWDTGDVEQRGTPLTNTHYRYSKAVVLVYSVDSKSSLQTLHFWITEAKKYAPKTALYVFVGNKFDIPASDRKVDDEEIQKFMARRKEETKGVDPIEYRISVKDNTGLNEALDDLLHRISSSEDFGKESAGVSLSATADDVRGGGCFSRC